MYVTIYIYIYYKSFFPLLDINIKYKLICFFERNFKVYLFKFHITVIDICINHAINFDRNFYFLDSMNLFLLLIDISGVR